MYFLQYCTILRHAEEKPFQCPHCDKDYSTTTILSKHLWLHTVEKPYFCCHCDKAFFGIL